MIRLWALRLPTQPPSYYPVSPAALASHCSRLSRSSTEEFSIPETTWCSVVLTDSVQSSAKEWWSGTSIVCSRYLNLLPSRPIPPAHSLLWRHLGAWYSTWTALPLQQWDLLYLRTKTWYQEGTVLYLHGTFKQYSLRDITLHTLNQTFFWFNLYQYKYNFIKKRRF